MPIKRNKTSCVILAIFFAGIVILSCVFIERYAKTALNSEIKYSHESGFYDEPIEVELSVGSSYFLTYTLDGSTPNVSSNRYSEPIVICDASENDNVWSDMMETSLLYYEYAGYDIPKNKVDKCTILRVSAFDYSGNEISTDVREYFIGFSDKTGYEGMYNLCVSTNPENLFSAEKGIYHVGEYLQGKIDSCKIYDMYKSGVGWDGEDQKANWFMTGRESERPATIEIFGPDGDLIARERCGVRVRGGISRSDVQKTLGFYAREEYSGNDYFSYDIFGDGYGPRNFLINSSGNDCNVKLVDYVIYNSLSKGENTFSVTSLIPCNLFLEGEYWGPMFLMKDINENAVANDYGVSKNNVIMIKNGEIKTSEEYEYLEESELKDWEDLQRFIESNDMSIQENYEYVCSKIDIENFAEYAATEVYVGNPDWHSDNNYACWRTVKSEKDNIYSDGKWRFCLFDVNWAFESDEVIWGETYPDWDFYQMVKCLGQNEEFETLFKDRVSDLEVLFASEKVNGLIAEWSNVMEDPIRCYFKRFLGNADADVAMEVKKNQIREFCENRPQTINTMYTYLFE